jgi:hypothetical protein
MKLPRQPGNVLKKTREGKPKRQSQEKNPERQLQIFSRLLHKQWREGK